MPTKFVRISHKYLMQIEQLARLCFVFVYIREESHTIMTHTASFMSGAGGRRDRTLYADSPVPAPLPGGFWPGSAGPWVPKAP